jgi:hypothetical protein
MTSYSESGGKLIMEYQLVSKEERKLVMNKWDNEIMEGMISIGFHS